MEKDEKATDPILDPAGEAASEAQVEQDEAVGADPAAEPTEVSECAEAFESVEQDRVSQSDALPEKPAAAASDGSAQWFGTEQPDVADTQVLTGSAVGQVAAGECVASSKAARFSAAFSKLMELAKGKGKMLAGIAAALVVFLVVMDSTGTFCVTHDWVDADCENPKRCLKCGAERGEPDPDGHSFHDATCITPKYCYQCQTYVGEPDPYAHSWNPPSCVSPATCKNCGKTKGTVIDHDFNSSGVCMVCGMTAEAFQSEKASQAASSEGEEEPGAESQAVTAAAAQDESGVDPSFKAAMDEYEAFFDSYIEFMGKYEANPGDSELLSSYADFMTQFSETMSEMDAIDEESLSDADLAYYVEVSTRIQEKLAKAAISMG